MTGFDFSDPDLLADVGEHFIVGFPDATDRAPDAIASALQARAIGGVICFRRNLDAVEQIASLTADIHRQVPTDAPAPWIAIDQEGGRVTRIDEPLTPIPPMAALGEAADLRDVGRISEVMATELATLGFTLNLAPVLDVHSNPDNPVIGDRSFGSDPTRVARCGAGFMLGHHTAGVVPCGKHFPGHGDTDLDSHLDLPVVDHDRQRLNQIELYPFERAIAADIPMIMTAHLMVPALDPTYPATFSPRILDGLLRRELGFDGLVITDCLEMKAVSDHYAITDMIDLGMAAGVDIFLISHTEAKWRSAIEHLYQSAVDDPAKRTKIADNARRIRTTRRQLLGHWPRPFSPSSDLRSHLGSPQHRALVAPYLDPRTDGDDPTAPSHT